jgi:hypothetical protein
MCQTVQCQHRHPDGSVTRHLVRVESSISLNTLERCRLYVRKLCWFNKLADSTLLSFALLVAMLGFTVSRHGLESALLARNNQAVNAAAIIESVNATLLQ